MNDYTRKEYIEREAAINAVFEAYADGRSAYIALEAIPAADVAPVVHGRWTSVFDIGTVCNQCGYDIEQHGFDVRTDGEPRYCPNCGVRMDKGGEEE